MTIQLFEIANQSDDGESESRETGRIPWRAAAQRGHKWPLCCCSERRNIDQETICENTGNPKTKRHQGYPGTGGQQRSKVDGEWFAV